MITVDLDLEGIRKSDMLVCVYPEDKTTIGVPCEMMFAYMLNMPIISIGSDEVLEHPWVFALSDGLFHNLDELYLYLTTIMKGDDDDNDDEIFDALREEEMKSRKKKK